MQLLNEIVFNFWIWWYFTRFRNLIFRQRRWIYDLARRTGFEVSARFFFVPLFQNYSVTGRIFSLVVRSINIFYGLVVMAFAVGLLAIFDVLYLLFPLAPLIKVGLIAFENL